MRHTLDRELLQRNVILIMAEDDDADFYLIRKAMEEVGVENQVLRMRDGEELMEYLYKQINEQTLNKQPIIILLDLNMPRKNGFEVLEEMRANEALSMIPIVVLTTSNDPRSIARCKKSGVHSFIPKPVGFGGMVTVMMAFNLYWLKTVRHVVVE